MRMTTRAQLAQSQYTDVVGLQVDYENNACVRLAGARGRTAGADFDCFAPFGGRRRCCVADDGTVNAWYGGTGYAEDGTNGQVMVCQPKFYYRVEPLKLTALGTGIGYALQKANYYISATPKPGFRLHPAFYGADGSAVERIFFSAYEASYYDDSLAAFFIDGTHTDAAIDGTDDRLCSLAGKKPISGTVKRLTKTAAETVAAARGTGWHIDTAKACAANQLLMAVEFGSLNLQNALGKGIVGITDTAGCNCASLTGSTAALGNGSGTAAETISETAGVQTVCTDTDKTAISYRGMENPWGNLWKHINGLAAAGEGASAGGKILAADGFVFSESGSGYSAAGFTLPPASGYVKTFGYGSSAYDWLFLPAETGGRTASPAGDYLLVTSNLNGSKNALYGGRWGSGDYTGGFFYSFTANAGYFGRDLGCRLIYVP